MFTFVSSAWTSLRANGQAWCCKAAWERVWVWTFECFMVKSSDESCMFCISHASCVVFSFMICTCMSFPMCNNLHFYGDTFCFRYFLTRLISKASFSALGRVQLPQDCQIRLSLVASLPPHTHTHTLSFTPPVHITAWGVPLFENSISFGPNQSVLSSFLCVCLFSLYFIIEWTCINLI